MGHLDQSAAVQSSEAGPDGGSVSTAVIENATGPKKMYVKCSSNVKGKRVFGKNHYCLYCNKSSTNLTKHPFMMQRDRATPRRAEGVQRNAMPRGAEEPRDAM